MIYLFGLTLTWATGDTQPTRIPDQLHRVLVYLHQTDGINIGQNPTVETTGTDLPKDRKKTTNQNAEGNGLGFALPLSGNSQIFPPFPFNRQIHPKGKILPSFLCMPLLMTSLALPATPHERTRRSQRSQWRFFSFLHTPPSCHGTLFLLTFPSKLAMLQLHSVAP